jgi:hypothetical protein
MGPQDFQDDMYELDLQQRDTVLELVNEQIHAIRQGEIVTDDDAGEIEHLESIRQALAGLYNNTRGFKVPELDY